MSEENNKFVFCDECGVWFNWNQYSLCPCCRNEKRIAELEDKTEGIYDSFANSFDKLEHIVREFEQKFDEKYVNSYLRKGFENVKKLFNSYFDDMEKGIKERIEKLEKDLRENFVAGGWAIKINEQIKQLAGEKDLVSNQVDDLKVSVGVDASTNSKPASKYKQKIPSQHHFYTIIPKDLEKRPAEPYYLPNGYVLMYKGKAHITKEAYEKGIKEALNEERIEFLRDWHWYLALEWHLEKMNDCFPSCKKCKCNFTDFEKQFEEKWQKRRQD